MQRTQRLLALLQRVVPRVRMQQVALLGDQQLSDIKMSLKTAKSTTVSQTMTYLSALTGNALAAPNGLALECTLTIWIPYYNSATTGISWVWANTYFAKPAKTTMHDKFDMYELEFKSRTLTPSETTGASTPST